MGCWLRRCGVVVIFLTGCNVAARQWGQPRRCWLDSGESDGVCHEYCDRRKQSYAIVHHVSVVLYVSGGVVDGA